MPQGIRCAGAELQCREARAHQPGLTARSVRQDFGMARALLPHRKGIVLVVTAAIAWSTAPFFTRLLPFDSWTILFWRGLFGGALIATILVLLQGRSGLQDFTRMERSGWLVASLSTLGMVCFIPSLQL